MHKLPTSRVNSLGIRLTKSLAVAVLLLSPFLVAAQNKSRSASRLGNSNDDHTLKVTAGVSGVSYTGELANLGQHINLMFSGGIIYKMVPHVSLKSELSFYKLSGSDAGTSNSFRNLSFQSQNFEGYASVMYELFDVTMQDRGKAIIVNPYGFAGLGFTTLNPTADLRSTRYALREFKTEDVTYSAATVTMPVGAGVRFEFTRRFGASLEAGYRFTFSDYLDDVSTTYINTAATDPIRAALADRGPEVGTRPAEPGAQRGDPRNKDGYLSVGVKLEFLLFPVDDTPKPQCPRGVNRKTVKVKK